MGWVMVAASLVGLNTFSDQYAVYGGVVTAGALPLVSVAAWLSMWTWTPFLLLPTLLPLLFPSGGCRRPVGALLLWGCFYCSG
jgi:hypothetical protein